MPRKWIWGALCVSVISTFMGTFALWNARAQSPPKSQINSTKSTFLSALPGYQFEFPRDHGAHPDYQTEWWYYTGHLQAESGEKFGYELTFFRFGLIPRVAPNRSKWAVRDIDFAHFAITDQDNKKYFFADRMERANMGLAETQIGKSTFLPRIWIDDWSLQFSGNAGNTQIIQAKSAAQNDKSNTLMAIDLTQNAVKPPIINGQNGQSKKGDAENASSHYYSMPRLNTSGTLTLGNRTYKVSGQSWLDREFGSGALSPEQRGWDWFSIQLDDGRDLMLYQIREKNEPTGPYSGGTLTDKSGKSTFLTRDDFRITPTRWWDSPHSGAKYPAGWEIELPKYDIALKVLPTVADQEMRPRHESAIYWEGSCTVSGTDKTINKSTFVGKAYVELTGYNRPNH